MGEESTGRTLLEGEGFRTVITYTEALGHIQNYCGGRKGDLNFLIRILAEAKGLPKRVGEKQAQEFFAVNQL